MKTILLFDARFRDRAPQRLRVADEIASAAVRSGAAAAADPAEHAGLVAGGTLDGGDLTEVVMEVAGGRLVRAVLPLSVVMVGAQAGKLASIGRAVGGGATPTPTPTPAPGGNAALLAATPKDGSAVVAVLGGSRQRQNNAGAGATEIRSMQSGIVTWAQVIGRRFRTTVYSSTGADQTASNIGGLFYANDGEGAVPAYQRVPAVLASDAHVVIVELSSNSLQLSDFDIYGRDLGRDLTVNGYLANYITIIEALNAGGKAVIVNDLVERNSAVGGVWAPGSRRSLVPGINDAMRTYCQGKGIPFIELRPSFIDPASGALNDPRAEVVRSDGTHWSAIGGYLGALIYDAKFSELGWQTAVPYSAAGNLIANPTMAGPSGAPTSYTLGRNGALATLTPATVAKGGRQWLEYSIDATAVGTAQEAVTITPSAPATEAGKWYVGRFRFEVDAWDAWYGAINALASAGGNSAKALMPMDAGGSGETDPTSTAMLKGPSQAYSGVLETPPFLAAAAAGFFRIISPSFRQSGTVGRFRISEVEYREVPNPALLTYDEANATPAAITSATTFTTPEEQGWETFLTANRRVRWSIVAGVADAASFAIDKHGRLRLLANSDFESKASYSVRVSAQPFNPALPAATQDIALTVTDIDDGFVDNFNRTAGTDVFAATGWTPIGIANAVVITNNRATNSNASGSARGGGQAPQQGDTVDQQVEWQAPTNSVGAFVAIMLQDVDNFFGVEFASGVPRFARFNAGVKSFPGTATPYKTVSSSDVLKLQRLNDQVRLYQNDVLIAGPVDVTGILPDAKRSGIVSNNLGSSNNQTIDNFRARRAVAVVPKIALKALTLTNDTLLTGQAYAGTVGNFTGVPNMVVTTDTSGLFAMDGFNLRTAAPLGPTGTVYSVTVAESNDNAAAPNPRSTTFTITVP
jgi:hypothetical protein